MSERQSIMRRIRVLLIGEQERDLMEWIGMLLTLVIVLPLITSIFYNIFSGMLIGTDATLTGAGGNGFLRGLALFLGVIVGLWCCWSYWKPTRPTVGKLSSDNKNQDETRG